MKTEFSPDTPATLATLATQALQAVAKPAEPAPVAAPSSELPARAVGIDPEALATLATVATRAPALADLARALGSAFAIETGPEGRRMVRTADVLAHAVEDDATDLLTPAVLVAFGWSLAADGLVATWTEPTTPAADPPAGPALVRCCDCQHFNPDTVGFGQGIGQCAIGDPTLPSDQPHMDYRHQAPAGERIRRYTIRTRPALWPRAERRCPGFAGLD